MKDMGNVVILSQEEYKYLLEQAEKLACLESHGVDNWSGYSDAMLEFNSEEERCEDCEANLSANEECSCDEE